MVPDALTGGPHFAAYCERYIRHTKGRWAGRPLVYEPWQREFSKEKADLMHAIYERITVAGPEIVRVRLTAVAYAHGLALALPQKVEMARPTGVGRALATYEIPIEGRDEWPAAARRLA